MRRLSIAMVAVISTMAFTQTASAAPPYNWTGFYAGGNAGYGSGNANDAMVLEGSWLTDGTGDNVPLTPLGNGQLKINGFVGGIQAGYNYQMGQWLLGIEVDADYFRMKKDFASGAFTNAASGNSYTFTSSFESNWLITVRPRLGYAFDRLLVYVTGGLAIADQKFSQNITQLNIAYTEIGSVSKTTAGWTAGVGAEYALDNRWSVKAEYLYVDPGSVSFSASGDIAPDYNSVHSAHLKASVVRAGLNYRFN